MIKKNELFKQIVLVKIENQTELNSKTKPDTRQDSCKRFGKGGNAKNRSQFKKVTGPTDVPTYQPANRHGKG